MKLSFVIPLLLFAMPAVTRGDLVNGGFETGDFTGWTTFDTAHGHTAVEQVVLFDTSGSGSASRSAQFNVGTLTVGSSEGSGIEQNVLLSSGTLNISSDIAVSSTIGNSDAGTFELLLNGTVVASHAFGSLGNSQVARGHLNYSATVSAGTYLIAIDMRRAYATDPRETPS